MALGLELVLILSRGFKAKFVEQMQDLAASLFVLDSEVICDKMSSAGESTKALENANQEDHLKYITNWIDYASEVSPFHMISNSNLFWFPF